MGETAGDDSTEGMTRIGEVAVAVATCSLRILKDDVSDDELGRLSANAFSTTSFLTSSVNCLSTLLFQTSFSLIIFARNLSFSL
jgi:hypothetical protein